jgi:membrane associated rhomboid family serine protease
LDLSATVTYPHYQVFDMLILITFGQAITNKYGNKLIWILYLFGALAGAVSMSYGTAHPLITPKVGS